MSSPRHTDPPQTLLTQQRLGPTLELGNGKRLRLRVALALVLIAGTPGIAGGAARMAAYAGLVLFALLVHELGHALCALAFGSRATIVLHVLGGYTSIEPPLSRRRERWAALMGPAASLLVGGLLWAAKRHVPGQHLLELAAWTNLAWGFVNLLPVLPFDGGRILLNLVSLERRSIALLVSGTLAMVIALEGLFVVRSAALVVVFGSAAFASLFDWAQQRRAEIEAALGLPEHLAEARLLLAKGDAERARQLATRVGVRAHANATANQAWEIVAWAELELGNAQDAYRTLGRIEPVADVPSYALAAVEAARGETRHAIGLLERARASGELGLGALKLLIDLHVRVGSLDRACDVTSSALRALDADDTRRVIEAALEADALVPATQLAGELFALTGGPDDAVTHAYGLARLGDRNTARRIFRELVALISDWEMHKATLARLRDLATRPDLSELIGPELSELVLAPTPA